MSCSRGLPCLEVRPRTHTSLYCNIGAQDWWDQWGASAPKGCKRPQGRKRPAPQSTAGHRTTGSRATFVFSENVVKKKSGGVKKKLARARQEKGRERPSRKSRESRERVKKKPRSVSRKSYAERRSRKKPGAWVKKKPRHSLTQTDIYCGGEPGNSVPPEYPTFTTPPPRDREAQRE